MGSAVLKWFRHSAKNLAGRAYLAHVNGVGILNICRETIHRIQTCSPRAYKDRGMNFFLKTDSSKQMNDRHAHLENSKIPNVVKCQRTTHGCKASRQLHDVI